MLCVERLESQISLKEFGGILKYLEDLYSLVQKGKKLISERQNDLNFPYEWCSNDVSHTIEQDIRKMESAR